MSQVCMRYCMRPARPRTHRRFAYMFSMMNFHGITTLKLTCRELGRRTLRRRHSMSLTLPSAVSTGGRSSSRSARQCLPTSSRITATNLRGGRARCVRMRVCAGAYADACVEVCVWHKTHTATKWQETNQRERARETNFVFRTWLLTVFSEQYIQVASWLSWFLIYFLSGHVGGSWLLEDGLCVAQSLEGQRAPLRPRHHSVPPRRLCHPGLSLSCSLCLLRSLSSALSLFFLSHADILRSLAHVSCFSSPLLLHCPAVVVTHVSSLCGVLNEREDTLKRPPIVCAFAIRAFYIRRRET